MKTERSRRLALSGSEGWSLPMTWILLAILIALHFAFGWIVWPAVIGLGLLVTGVVWVSDRVRVFRARRELQREWRSWPEVEADWIRGMRSPQQADPKVTAERFVEFLSAHGYEFDFTSSSLISEVDALFDAPVFALGPEELKRNTQGGLAAYIGETLAREFDGKWEGEFRQDDPGANFYGSSVKFGDHVFFPSRFIGDRLSNGPSEGSFADYLWGELPAIREGRDAVGIPAAESGNGV